MDPVIVVKAIGIVFVLIGLVCLSRPEALKRVLQFYQKGKRLYLVGLVRLALAVVFFSSYRQCNRRWIIFGLGIVFLISGLLIFVLGLEKVKSIVSWYERQSSVIYRVLALVALAVGVVVILSA